MSRLCAIVLVGALSLVGCGEAASPPSAAAGKPRIVATIYPLADIATHLAGDGAEVVCLLPAGQSPHAFELSAQQMDNLSQAKLILAVGLGLDHWVDHAAATAGRGNATIFTLAEAADGELGPDDASGHEHAHEHLDHAGGHEEDDGHHHGPIDPHLWLDPVLVRRAIGPVTDALIRALPGEADSIRQRAGEYEADLIALDAAFTEQLRPFRGRKIVTFHSAFNRLAARYGLEVATTLTPIETVGTITPGSLDQAIRAIEQYDLRVIFAEPQFSPDAADMLARRTGVAVLILDPLGDPARPDRAGYLPVMRYNLRTLVDGLSR